MVTNNNNSGKKFDLDLYDKKRLDTLFDELVIFLESEKQYSEKIFWLCFAAIIDDKITIDDLKSCGGIPLDQLIKSVVKNVEIKAKELKKEYDKKIINDKTKFGTIAIEKGLIKKADLAVAIEKQVTKKRVLEIIKQIRTNNEIDIKKEKQSIIKLFKEIYGLSDEKNIYEVVKNKTKPKKNILNRLKIGQILEDEKKLTIEEINEILEDQSKNRKYLFQTEDFEIKVDNFFTKEFKLKKSIAENGMRAVIRFDDSCNIPKDTTIKDIREIIKQILYIKPNKDTKVSDIDIQAFINNCNNGAISTLIIAEGVFPIDGEDEKIESNFSNYFKYGNQKPNARKRKKIDKKGEKIDITPEKIIPVVLENETVIKIIPAIKGVDGKNIFGNYIPFNPGEPVEIEIGDGIKKTVDEKGKTIYIATKKGVPKYKKGKLSITNEVTFDKEYKNLNVIVDDPEWCSLIFPEKVRSKVICNNFEAQEVYDGGEIIAKGKVEIKGGIYNENTKVKAGKLLEVERIHGSKNIEAKTINISGEMTDAKIKCKSFNGKNTFQLNGASTIEIAKNMDINGPIGKSEKGSPTLIINDPDIKKLIEELKKVDKKIRIIESKIEGKTKKVNGISIVSDFDLEKKKKKGTINEKMKLFFKKANNLEEKKKKILNEIKKIETIRAINPIIKCNSSIIKGTKIIGENEEYLNEKGELVVRKQVAYIKENSKRVKIYNKIKFNEKTYRLESNLSSNVELIKSNI